MPTPHRRDFLAHSTAAVALAASSYERLHGANERHEPSNGPNQDDLAVSPQPAAVLRHGLRCETPKRAKLTDHDHSVINGARDQLERQNSGTLPESSGPKGSGRAVQFADVVIWIYRINKEPLAP